MYHRQSRTQYDVFSIQFFLCLFHIYTEVPTTTEYTKTNLYRDSEGLFVETLNEIISDPFNKIKHSEHASNFPSLASNSEFILEFEVYLTPALSPQPISKLFLQSLTRKFFEKIVLAIKKAAAKPESSCMETQMTNVEENILRYAAGYVPFALRRQCLKREHNSEWKQKAKCLGALQVENEDEELHSGAQMRGGGCGGCDTPPQYLNIRS